MKGLIYLLDGKHDDFSDTELILSNYIVANLKTIDITSLDSLARKAHVSNSTVTRLAKKLGYSGFKTFKLDLIKEIASSDINTFVDENNENFLSEVAENLFKQDSAVLFETKRLLKSKVISDVAKEIYNANKIACIGIGASDLVARDLILKLLRLEITALRYDEYDTTRLVLNQFSKGDVVIAVSYSGIKVEILELVKLAKQNGATIITITRASSNELSLLADLNLFVAAYEQTYRSSATSSRIAQMYIIDVVFHTLIKEYPLLKDRLQSSYEVVKGQKRML